MFVNNEADTSFTKKRGMTWAQRQKTGIQSYGFLLSPLTMTTKDGGNANRLSGTIFAVHVGNIDIEVCDICGKKVKVIACIEDLAVIKQILEHLKKQMPATIKYVIPEGRLPPQRSLFTD